MNNHNTILNLNANLKYIEYLLYIFDNENDDTRLGEIKKKFENHFSTNAPLLNQYFGLIRLIPLLLIKEVYKEERKELEGDIEKIKVIRDSLAHNNFLINEKGFIFSNDKTSLKISYNDFQIFLHKIENDFYRQNSQTT
ncbi:MAG: hypothetical protein V1688_02510 [bacterium]